MRGGLGGEANAAGDVGFAAGAFDAEGMFFAALGHEEQEPALRVGPAGNVHPQVGVDDFDEERRARSGHDLTGGLFPTRPDGGDGEDRDRRGGEDEQSFRGFWIHGS